MRICDLTMAYSETSGGIRTYIDHKRRYLLEHTGHEHVLIVPGAKNSVERTARTYTRRIKSPPTGHGSYRLLWRPDQILEALHEASPDIVELGTFFVCPWPAFHYRGDERRRRRRVAVAGYFHTDLANAYVQAPVEDTLRGWFAGWSATLEGVGEELAELLGTGAERYFGSIFERCDVMLTSSPAQAARLREYGVADPQVIPLGVDVATFRPDRRSATVRERFGAGADTCVLVYAGRLDAEKHVDTLADTLAELVRRGRDVRLVMVGDGPERDGLERRRRRLPQLHLPGFVADTQALAELLASADVYVTAGPYETFGLSVIEAQAAGLPVVGVDAGALRSRVAPGTGYLGPVDDVAAMADHVERAFAERAALSRAARTLVEEHFSWDACFERLLEVYTRLLARD